MIPVLYSCFDFHMICNSDSIRLDIRWHEIKVDRWGFPCLDYSFDVLVSWGRNLSVYNQFCLWSVLHWISCFMSIMCSSSFMMLMLYPFLYILHLCSNPLVFCTWLLYSPLARHLAFASYSPGEFHWLPWILMSRSWHLERGFPPLLLRVAQR